ncbi:MAG: hypothetical protein ACRCTD_12510 [Beijerinckiaceae bacterium]
MRKSDIDTVEDSIRLIPNELNDYGVGLGHVWAKGHGYHKLRGVLLEDFIRRVILELLAHGALPAHEGSFTEYRILDELHYGSDTPEEIADGILQDMRAMGRPPDWGEFWFRLPDDPHRIELLKKRKEEQGY